MQGVGAAGQTGCFPFAAGLAILVCVHRLPGCFSGRFQSLPSEAFHADLVFPGMLLCVSCVCGDHTCGVVCALREHVCGVVCVCCDHTCGVVGALCDHTCVVCAVCEHVWCGVSPL